LHSGSDCAASITPSRELVAASRHHDWPDPVTRTGTALPAVLLFPSWPAMLSPQQYTALVLVTAHVCLFPALTEVKVSVLETGTGTLLGVVLLFPNCPATLPPQQ
jgi:hypothetical protein